MGKREKIIFIVKICVVFIATLVCGIYSSKATFYENAEGIYKISRSRYQGFQIIPNEGVSLETIDIALKEADAEYGGYLSSKSILTGKIESGKKAFDEEILLLNPSFNAEILIENKNISVPDGYLKAYASGWEWDGVDIGSKLILSLTKKDGNQQKINLILAGKACPNILHRPFVGEARFAAFRGMLVVEGLDIADYVENPYASIYAYSSRQDILYTYSKPDTSLNAMESLDNSVQSSATFVNFNMYKLVYVILLLVVVLISIWFLDKKYKFAFYILFGTGTTFVMTIYYLSKLKSQIILPYIQFFGQFIGIVSSIIGLSILLATISMFLTYRKEKLLKKVDENDTVAKYL